MPEGADSFREGAEALEPSAGRAIIEVGEAPLERYCCKPSALAPKEQDSPVNRFPSFPTSLESNDGVTTTIKP